MMVPQQQRRRRRRAAVPRAAERRVIVARGPGGFGFTIAGQRPCVVSAVAAGGPAVRAGLRAGDALLAVDGASVARAPHAAVARLVATAPGAISLSVALRDCPPTDTEDTEPDERARTRRRHLPPRRRPQPVLHLPGRQPNRRVWRASWANEVTPSTPFKPHLWTSECPELQCLFRSQYEGCHAAPSLSGVNEVLQNLSRAQLTPSHAVRLECRAVVGYLGTIETPQAAATAAPGDVRSAVRKLRQERRPATPVLLSVLPNALLLRRPTGQVMAQYTRERIVYAGCGSDADRRYFGLVTSAETTEAEASHSCHVFAVDPRTADHEAHAARAREFQITCTRDPVAERCLEFPPSAEYVVGVIRGMYSLPPDDCSSPTLQQISKLAVKGDSPALGHFSRCNRPVFRVPRDRRPCRHEDARIDGQEFVANSPQPSNHSEMTTTSSNSDSGIGFHNDGRNIAERILVVDFAGQQLAPNRFRQDMPRRPAGLVGCSSFEADGSFLSNTTPVVDGFAGQGRPLNLDDVILNSNELQPVRHLSSQNEEDNYNYNNVYGNLPSTSRSNGAVYDAVYTENEGHYELVPTTQELDVDCMSERFNSVEIYEERSRTTGWQSSESVESATVVSGGTGDTGGTGCDAMSVRSSRSHEEARPARRHHLQASLDDMLMLRDPPANNSIAPPPMPDDNFLHPAAVKCKVRKSMKPFNILTKTKHMLTGRDREKKSEARRRAISASAGDVCGGESGASGGEELPAAASEPDLRDTQSEQSSPFRRWTTGSGAGSSYRHHGYNKPMSEPSTTTVSEESSRGSVGSGAVARWSLGLEHLLADPTGAAAFASFLAKEFAHENIRFWWACESYANTTDCELRSRLAGEIWQRHLAEGASEPVNVDAAARRAAQLRLAQDPPPTDLFIQAQKQIFNVMKFDSYPRFLRSTVHAQCARADLLGESPLFAPYIPDPNPSPSRAPKPRTAGAPPAPAPTPEQSPTKLKKSASNASERRRSGGLLPWKRAASRDRANGTNCTTPTPSTSDAQHPLTDVVKSGSVSGQCSLCRVVLPDGATSVVEVEDSVTVRRLVDRLLQRRNLQCPTYDVLLKDCAQGEQRVIDAACASSALGGREVVVERRCVVRVEVGARCVAVRCRTQRRLRHVLRPVLARYAPPRANNAPAPARAVLRDGLVVHPDTSMQDLDGARLQIVELTEGGEFVRTLGRDDDTDSLSDLALRVQEDGRDDDLQSTASTSSRRAEYPASVTATSSAPAAACAGTSGAGASSGRVRAALKPGPPLHHHPPDFLENLRETQRQRFQNKNEPSPAPRTPPPLPPKPSQRQPTLV